jgi:hypothetical protein
MWSGALNLLIVLLPAYFMGYEAYKGAFDAPKRWLHSFFGASGGVNGTVFHGFSYAVFSIAIGLYFVLLSACLRKDRRLYWITFITSGGLLLIWFGVGIAGPFEK